MSLTRNLSMSPTSTYNPSFSEWTVPEVVVVRNNVELCDGWFIQRSPSAAAGEGGHIVARPAHAASGSGLRLNVPNECSWVRIYQPWTPPVPGRATMLEVALELGDEASPTGPKLDWIAVLRVDDSGKRVFARRILKGKRTGAGALAGRFEPSGFHLNEQHYLAIQFDGAVGEITVRRCEIVEAPENPPLRTPPPRVRVPPALTPPAPGPSRPRPVHEPRPAPAPGPAPRGKVAVVAWDLGHNPAGRAFLLADLAGETYDAEVIGPLFPAYGGKLWSPITDQQTLPIRTFPASDLRTLVEGARDFARQVTCDVVYVSKPRLPALLLATLIKQVNDCPMVVDVDDRETSFFPAITTPSLADIAVVAELEPERFAQPYSDIWTAFGESLVKEAEAVTVSNVALKETFGGTIVRHARNEEIFDPAKYDRTAVRREFGYGPDDRVVLFLGTPRPHKGVFDIADAMELLAIPSLALCVIGSPNDLRVSKQFSKYVRARVDLHADQPWDRLPELVSMADAVMILQDPLSRISAHQIPAKLTDALAMGVPVYARPVPPLRDLIDHVTVRAVPDTVALGNALREIAGSAHPAAAPAREHYFREFSYRANAERLAAVLDEARRAPRRPTSALDDLLGFVEQQTGVELPRFDQARRQRARSRRPGLAVSEPVDVVFLWKQNDSDIYGRRSDMLVKHLLGTSKVRRVLHLDAPITPRALEAHISHDDGVVAHQGKYVFLNTMKRILKAADEPNLTRRTFLYQTEAVPSHYAGLTVLSADAYPDFIERSMLEAGIGKNRLLVVAPVVHEYEIVRDVVDPSLVLADVVDDQRKWHHATEERARRIADAYGLVLSDADIVTCNCEPVRQGFAHLRDDLHVIPNGAEFYPDMASWPVPSELQDLPRPILGYVGNLRDRFDYSLIRKVAREHRDGSIVLIGSAHGTSNPEYLANEPNVHFFGVKPYDEAIRFIKCFDVALLPHVANDLSLNMNPLKLYVYAALDVPIVASAVANIGDLASLSLVAADHGDFLRHISRVLAGEADRLPRFERIKKLADLSWEARIDAMWRLLPGEGQA